MRKFLAIVLLLLAFTIGAAIQNTQGTPTIKVWVNASSRVYHCPGTKYYGNTKRGEYMTQKEAQDKGNRPAYGRVCK